VNLLTSLHRIAKLMGAPAMVGSQTDQAVRCLAGRALDILPDVEVWEVLGLANSIWACAKLRIDDTPNLAALSAAAVANASHFDHQNLSNTAWAFATLR